MGQYTPYSVLVEVREKLRSQLKEIYYSLCYSSMWVGLGSISGGQAWWQASLPDEPSFQPFSLSFQLELFN